MCDIERETSVRTFEDVVVDGKMVGYVDHAAIEAIVRAAQHMELVCCLREALIALSPDQQVGPAWVASLRSRIRTALAMEPAR